MYSLCVPRSKSVQTELCQFKCGVADEAKGCVRIVMQRCRRAHHVQGSLLSKTVFIRKKREGQPLAFLSGAFFSGDVKSYSTWWIKQLDCCSENSLMSAG